MKKKVLGIMMCFCLMAGMMSGCGADSESAAKNEEQPENSEAENAGTENSFDPLETEDDSKTEEQSEEAAQVIYYLVKETEYVECRYSSSGFHTEGANEYDVSGKLIKESEFVHDSLDPQTGEMNHIESSTEYGYDEAGNLIFQEIWKEAGQYSYEVNKRIEYEYDETGNLISTSDGQKYEYDEEGKLISIVKNDNNRTEYKYDEAGNLISVDDVGIDGISYGTGYEYDEAGNLVKKTTYNTEGIIEEREYDTAGNEIKNIYYQSSDGVATYEQEYDAAGNMIKQDEYRRGEDELSSSREYEYDKKGRLTKIITTSFKDYDGLPFAEPSPYEHVYTYEEEYDDAGNLIKVSTYGSGRLLSYIEYEYAVQ